MKLVEMPCLAPIKVYTCELNNQIIGVSYSDTYSTAISRTSKFSFKRTECYSYKVAHLVKALDWI